MTTSVGRAITVRGLRKAYGGVPAVDGVDLDVRRGEVFALLGPNGAGKTTTVEILEGHRDRDAGEVSVLGVGMLAFGVQLPASPQRWLTFGWVAVLGVSSCTLLGIAFSSLARSGKNAPAVVTPVALVLLRRGRGRRRLGTG